MNQITFEGSPGPFTVEVDTPHQGKRREQGVRTAVRESLGQHRASHREAAGSPGWWRSKLVDSSGVIALLALWELGPRLHWIDSQFFPPLSAVLKEGWTLLSSGALLLHIGASLLRTLTGLLVAIGTAVPLGFVLGAFFPRLTRFFRSLFTLLGQVNAFSLFPLFVLFFGIGELAKFGIIYWSCFWPLFFGTLAGVRTVDPLMVKTAKSMSCARKTLVFEVLFPAALPTILTGIRIGATVAFLMLIAAEMVGAQTARVARAQLANQLHHPSPLPGRRRHRVPRHAAGIRPAPGRNAPRLLEGRARHCLKGTASCPTTPPRPR